MRKECEESTEYAEKSRTSNWGHQVQIKTPIDIKIINTPDDSDHETRNLGASSNIFKGSITNPRQHQQPIGLNAPQSMIDCSYSGPTLLFIMQKHNNNNFSFIYHIYLSFQRSHSPIYFFTFPILLNILFLHFKIGSVLSHLHHDTNWIVEQYLFHHFWGILEHFTITNHSASY